MSRVAVVLAALIVPGAAIASEDLPITGMLSLLAPVVAVALALVTRKVIPALAAGAVFGALIAGNFRLVPTLHALWDFLGRSVLDFDHLTITCFSLLVAATVGVVSRAGGTRALVERIQWVAKGPRRTVVATWLAGLVVFFDDYANCLVVGNAMRPLFDRYRISRAKLAYVVDCTAAPVASLAVVSSWVGYEVGLVEEALVAAESQAPAFSVFLSSLPYRFYSLFTLAFALAIAWSGRDFGPMWTAVDQSAGRLPRLEQIRSSSTSPWVAVVPMIALVALTFTHLIWDGTAQLGWDAPLFLRVGTADPYRAMVIGSLVALVLAVAMSLYDRALPVRSIGVAAWAGMRPVLLQGLSVLYLAWMLGDAVQTTGGPAFLAGLLDGLLTPALIPTAAYLLAGGIAFASGTSYGTMAILFPLAIPLAVSAEPGGPGPVLWGTTAAVLAGSCLGDHASPISDTTVLSAIGSGEGVLSHFRTQLPYALVVGVVTLVIGFVPAGLGVQPWVLLPIGAAACVLIVRLVGRTHRVSTGTPTPPRRRS